MGLVEFYFVGEVQNEDGDHVIPSVVLDSPMKLNVILKLARQYSFTFP